VSNVSNLKHSSESVGQVPVQSFERAFFLHHCKLGERGLLPTKSQQRSSGILKKLRCANTGWFFHLHSEASWYHFGPMVLGLHYMGSVRTVCQTGHFFLASTGNQCQRFGPVWKKS